MFSLETIEKQKEEWNQQRRHAYYASYEWGDTKHFFDLSFTTVEAAEQEIETLGGRKKFIDVIEKRCCEELKMSAQDVESFTYYLDLLLLALLDQPASVYPGVDSIGVLSVRETMNAYLLVESKKLGFYDAFNEIFCDQYNAPRGHILSMRDTYDSARRDVHILNRALMLLRKT